MINIWMYKSYDESIVRLIAIIELIEPKEHSSYPVNRHQLPANEHSSYPCNGVNATNLHASLSALYEIIMSTTPLPGSATANR